MGPKPVHPIFSVSLTPAGSRIVIAGELDLTCRNQLRRHLAEAEELSRTSLHLDLSGVTFVDAGCLRTIDASRRRLEAGGGRLEVVAASAPFRRASAAAGYAELAGSTDEPGSAAASLEQP